MYQFERMVGASPDLETVNSRPEEVAVTFPAVIFQASLSKPEVVKSCVYVLEERAGSSGQAGEVSGGFDIGRYATDSSL